MGRRPGARNSDYQQVRHDMAARIAAALLREDGEPASLADLARAVGVSATTLMHYFGNRDGAYRAAMEAVLADGRTYVDRMADPGDRTPDRSVPGVLLGTVEAWRAHGLGRVFTGGLARGLASEHRGPDFLGGVLEPFVRAVERLLETHRDRGELPAHDTREVALALLSPVVVALLHQDALGGASTRPLDVERFARAHAELVLAGVRARRPGDGRSDQRPGR